MAADLGMTVTRFERVLSNIRKKTGLKGRNFPISEEILTKESAFNGGQSAQILTKESGHPDHRVSFSIGDKETTKETNTLIETRNLTNESAFTTMNPNPNKNQPSEAPTASPLEYDPKDVPFESDPNFIHRVKTLEEEYAEFEAMEDLKAKRKIN